ncbi:MAG: hypothetical protein LBD73_00435 [Deferribacteraceae bacterium]|jgi:predicted transposase/invertase (TIGR01784 family)|nr:hypothetical protein [Deferribacteraceae bacterium]
MEYRAYIYIEAREEGEARGRAEGKAETALNLLNLGIPIELIAQAAKLSIEELEKLKSK